MQPRKYMPLLILAGYTAMGASEQALSLEDAIRVALENNFSYRIAAIDPEIAKENVTGQEAAFDTVIFASGQVSQYEESSPGINSSDYRNWKAGAQKRLVYGTTVTAQTNLDRSAGESNNVRLPLNQEADFSLSIRQPLLRGFGREANTANIERAKAGFTATTEGYRQAVLDLLAQTEAAYWQVARLQEKLSLDESNLTVAETLLEEAVEKKRVGLATSIEVLQAEAFRAETKEAIIDTTRALGDAYDLLLVYMGSLPGTGFSIGANQPVQALPENGRPLPEFLEAWTLAL